MIRFLAAARIFSAPFCSDIVLAPSPIGVSFGHELSSAIMLRIPVLSIRLQSLVLAACQTAVCFCLLASLFWSAYMWRRILRISTLVFGGPAIQPSHIQGVIMWNALMLRSMSPSCQSHRRLGISLFPERIILASCLEEDIGPRAVGNLVMCHERSEPRIFKARVGNETTGVTSPRLDFVGYGESL